MIKTKLIQSALILTLLPSCKESSLSSTPPSKEEPPISLTNTTQSSGITGPFSHKNLAVYLIRDERPSPDLNIITLQEAMTQKLVTVHETGDVNELKIENKSPDSHIFIHSGDIVKGGKQDRTLPNSIVLAPNSKPTPIDSFCVEQSRWSQRGNEKLDAFSSSSKSLNSKELKIAARKSKDQGKVWEEVSKYQEKLSTNLGKSARSEVSATSLQLTLEDKDLEKLSREYLDAITSQISDTKNVSGYAFAINGEFNSADLYVNSSLFSKVWPNRLEAAANEAIAELDPKKNSPHPDSASIALKLAPAKNSPPEVKKLPNGNRLLVNESTKSITFDAHYQSQSDDHRIHRNTIAKSQ